MQTNEGVKSGLVGKMNSDQSAGEQLVAQGATLVRLENTTQMTVAIQRPRDEREILKKALEELDIYPSLAKEALYSKPVGKEDGKQKYATGLSIRAAESLGNRWSNSAYACEISEETNDYVILVSVFLDYETNTRHVFPMRVSKTYKSREKGIVRYTSDRFDTVIAAAKSKLLRETILRSMPAGLKSEYEAKVRDLLTKEPPAKRAEKMVAAFAKFSITADELEKLRGKKIAEFTHDDLDELLGSYNALKEGEITKESLFSEGFKREGSRLEERMNGAASGEGTDAPSQPESQAPISEEEARKIQARELGEATGSKPQKGLF